MEPNRMVRLLDGASLSSWHWFAAGNHSPKADADESGFMGVQTVRTNTVPTNLVAPTFGKVFFWTYGHFSCIAVHRYWQSKFKTIKRRQIKTATPLVDV